MDNQMRVNGKSLMEFITEDYDTYVGYATNILNGRFKTQAYDVVSLALIKLNEKFGEDFTRLMYNEDSLNKWYVMKTIQSIAVDLMRKEGRYHHVDVVTDSETGVASQELWFENYLHNDRATYMYDEDSTPIEKMDEIQSAEMDLINAIKETASKQPWFDAKLWDVYFSHLYELILKGLTGDIKSEETSYRKLAEETGIGLSTIARTIKDMKDLIREEYISDYIDILDAKGMYDEGYRLETELQMEINERERNLQLSLNSQFDANP